MQCPWQRCCWLLSWRRIRGRPAHAPSPSPAVATRCASLYPDPVEPPTRLIRRSTAAGITAKPEGPVSRFPFTPGVGRPVPGACAAASSMQGRGHRRVRGRCAVSGPGGIRLACPSGVGRAWGHLVQAAPNGLRRPCSAPCVARRDIPARCASCGLEAMQPLPVERQGHECSLGPDRPGAPGSSILGIPSIRRSSRWAARAADFAGESVSAHPRPLSSHLPARAGYSSGSIFGAALPARARETHSSRHPRDPSGRARRRSPHPPPPPPGLPAHLRRSLLALPGMDAVDGYGHGSPDRNR